MSTIIDYNKVDIDAAYIKVQEVVSLMHEQLCGHGYHIYLTGDGYDAVLPVTLTELQKVVGNTKNIPVDIHIAGYAVNGKLKIDFLESLEFWTLHSHLYYEAHFHTKGFKQVAHNMAAQFNEYCMHSLAQKIFIALTIGRAAYRANHASQVPDTELDHFVSLCLQRGIAFATRHKIEITKVLVGE